MQATEARPAAGAGRWTPLLEGELRAAALATVARIADAVLDASADETDPSVASGLAGRALLYAYAGEIRPDAPETAVCMLNGGVRAARTARLDASLFGGLAGVAWSLRHLRARLEPGRERGASPLDEVLLAHAGRVPWWGEYDLVSGLVGLGVYALELLPHPNGAALLERVVSRLAETAERSEEGVTWFTAPELLVEWQRAECPFGYYNLGLAHGVPGVLALLAMAVRAGIAEERARPLLEGAVRWLLARRQPAESASTFDFWFVKGAAPRRSRLAWCYGDLGAAAALHLAGRCAGSPEWERAALEIALRAAERDPAETGVRDAGLCHGAAGLGHIFNRLYQASGEERLAAAARWWFAQALRMGEGERGIAGYAAWDGLPDGTPDWKAEAGFLNGAAGIGLALLSAAAPVEPEWDRLLLLSAPVLPQSGDQR